MLLRVKNLGPVREAELDLGKPLIVLTGPNNSGKTYLAWAAYSLARANRMQAESPLALRAWVDELFARDDQALDIKTLLDVYEDCLRALAKAVGEKLPEDFAASRNRFDETALELLAARDEGQAILERHGSHGTSHGDHSLSLVFDEGRVQVCVWDRPARDRKRVEIPIASLDEVHLSTVKASVAKLALHTITGAFVDRRYVALPVERLAINLFARELAAARTELVDELLIDAADSLEPTALREKLQSRAGQYPLVIRDALQAAMRLSGKAKTGPLADLADEIEASMLGGSVKLDAFDEIYFFPHQEPSLPLRLHETASVVKSLVSLVLHLRYEAREGQRLVIDEPELNLHPDNQRLIARILAKAVNRGLKIMMSTHSDYVIRELNNLVMLGQDSEKSRVLVQELGYHPDETLRPDQIGAYLVNDGSSTALEVTETGFESETIEREIHKLNHDAQTIYFRLFDE